MTHLNDPAFHRHTERKLVEHALRLLEDQKLRIDTTDGTRPVSGLKRVVRESDRSEEIRKLAGPGGADPETLNRLPRGMTIEILFRRPKLLLLGETTARLVVACWSPWKQLLRGEAVRPMTTGEVNRLVEDLKSPKGVPSTVILLCTGGFAADTHDLAERVASRTLVMVEPNAAGGFSVWGPAEMKALTDLIDPETVNDKRNRVRQYVKQMDSALSDAGLPSDKCVLATMLPLAIVEDEFRAIAKGEKGMTAKRLDGRIVLYREGANPTGLGVGAANPVVERVKSIFSGRTSHEKRVAFMNERRQTLLQQRQTLDDEMELLEKKDGYLRDQFRDATSEPGRRRAVAQLSHVRRQLERRQGVVKVLNQQLDAVADHLATLDSMARGESGEINVDQMAADAMKSEELLAKLRGEIELAEAGPVGIGTTLSAEEQALFDELARNAK